MPAATSSDGAAVPVPAVEVAGDAQHALTADSASNAAGARRLGPAVLFFLLVFVVPVGLMVRYGFLKQLPDGSLTTLPTPARPRF